MTKLAAAHDDTLALADPRDAMIASIVDLVRATVRAADVAPQLRAALIGVPELELRGDDRGAFAGAADSRARDGSPDRSAWTIEQRLELTQRLAGLASIRARRLTDIERRAVDAAAADVQHLLDLSLRGSQP